MVTKFRWLLVDFHWLVTPTVALLFATTDVAVELCFVWSRGVPTRHPRLKYRRGAWETADPHLALQFLATTHQTLPFPTFTHLFVFRPDYLAGVATGYLIGCGANADSPSRSPFLDIPGVNSPEIEAMSFSIALPGPPPHPRQRAGIHQRIATGTSNPPNVQTTQGATISQTTTQ